MNPSESTSSIASSAFSTATIPSWLEDTKETLKKSPEWQGLLNETYRMLRKQMSKDNIESFSDLSPDESALFVAQIESKLSSKDCYTKFVRQLSTVMDHNIQHVVDKTFFTDFNSKTKLEIMQDTAAEGCVSLLQTLPREKQSILRIMLNAPFPGPLRWRAWKTYLRYPASKTEYEAKINHRRIDTISSMDTEITQKCQVILDSKFRSLQDADSTQRNVLMVMKTVLSYYHTIVPNATEDQGDGFYSMMIPIMIVYGERDQRIAALVEAYLALHNLPRPRVCDSVSHIDSKNRFTQDFVTRLKSVDTILYEFLVEIVKKDGGTAIDEKVTMLVSPYVEHVFVGIASVEVTLFIWDQCLMAGFDRILYEVCVSFLVLLRKELMFCGSVSGLCTTIENQSKLVTVRRLQRCLQAQCMPKIRQELGISDNIDFHECISTNYIKPLVMPTELTYDPSVSMLVDGPQEEEEIVLPPEQFCTVSSTDSSITVGLPLVFDTDMTVEDQKLTWHSFYPEHDSLLDTVERIKSANSETVAKLSAAFETDLQTVVKRAVPYLQIVPNERLWVKEFAGKTLVIRVNDQSLDSFSGKASVVFELKRWGLWPSEKNHLDDLVKSLLDFKESAEPQPNSARPTTVPTAVASDSTTKEVIKENPEAVPAARTPEETPPSSPKSNVIIDAFDSFTETAKFIIRGRTEEEHRAFKSEACKILKELHAVDEAAQKKVYKRIYTEKDIAEMTDKAKKEYDKKYPKYVKEYTKQHELYEKFKKK